MAEGNQSVERRLEWMAEEILLLKEVVDELSGRLAAFEQGGNPGRVVASVAYDREALADGACGAREAADGERSGHDLWLSRLATTCFVLVVALILRTVTDNGMVEKHLGSLLGSGYALALIGWGWRLYERQSRLAPVFPVCGVLLLLSIVFEAHAHFASLSNSAVYAILLAASGLAVGLGLRCRASVLLYLGSLGPTLLAVGLELPEVDVLWVAVFMFTATLAGYLADRRRMSPALSWIALAITALFWLFWAYKLSYLLQHNGLAGAEKLGLHLYLPILGGFWLFYLYSAMVQTLARDQELGVLSRLLPAVTLAGGFGLAQLVVVPWSGSGFGLALLTLAGGCGYLALAAWLAKQEPETVRGCKEYLVAGIVAFLLALPLLTNSMAVAMVVWSGMALLLFRQGEVWRSGGVRVISYLLAVVVGVAALKVYPLALAQPAIGMALAAGVLAGLSLWHYRCCRRQPPAYDSIYFTLFDTHDRSAVVVLLVGLLQGFNLLRLLVLLAMATPHAETASSFGCAQSIILNLGAVVLLLAGLRARQGEVLVVAVVVVLCGAGRVFLVDLFHAEGIPLVLSVFSFGVVAAVCSWVERRWRNL